MSVACRFFFFLDGLLKLLVGCDVFFLSSFKGIFRGFYCCDIANDMYYDKVKRLYDSVGFMTLWPYNVI